MNLHENPKSIRNRGNKISKIFPATRAIYSQKIFNTTNIYTRNIFANNCRLSSISRMHGWEHKSNVLRHARIQPRRMFLKGVFEQKRALLASK